MNTFRKRICTNIPCISFILFTIFCLYNGYGYFAITGIAGLLLTEINL